MKRYNNMRDHYVRAESAREEAFNIIEEHLHEMSITREDALRRLNDARAKGEEEQRQGLFFKRKMQEIRKMQETQPT
jgi:uncharacterized protein YwgA